MASTKFWYAWVRGRCGSSPRPRASHSHTVVRATSASPQAAVKVEPRRSAIQIVTCTATDSFVGRPRARDMGVGKFGILTHTYVNLPGRGAHRRPHPPAPTFADRWRYCSAPWGP